MLAPTSESTTKTKVFSVSFQRKTNSYRPQTDCLYRIKDIKDASNTKIISERELTQKRGGGLKPVSFIEMISFFTQKGLEPSESIRM